MCIIPPTMCNALLSYSRRLGTHPDMEHVSQTNHASKNMIMKTVTSLHDVGREEGWALLDDQKWKMVVVLNATVYGVMKRCLKKKRYTVDKFLGTTVNHVTSRTNVASTSIEQNVVKNQLNAQLLLVALLYTLHGFVILQAFAAREPP